MLIDIVETRVMNKQVLEPMEILAWQSPKKTSGLLTGSLFKVKEYIRKYQLNVRKKQGGDTKVDDKR